MFNVTTEISGKVKYNTQQQTAQKNLGTSKQHSSQLLARDTSIPTKMLKFEIGRLSGSTTHSVSITPETLLGRNCAILGSTCSGKTWTLASIIDHCIELRSKIIIFDETCEFASLDKRIMHLSIGPSISSEIQEFGATIPQFCLTQSDVISLLSTGTSDPLGAALSVRQALNEIRLQHRVQANRNLQDNHSSESVEEPNTHILEDLRHFFYNQLEDHSNNLNSQHGLASDHKDSAHSKIEILENLERILHSPENSRIFSQGGKTSIFSWVTQFMREPFIRAARISLKSVPKENHMRSIVKNLIIRSLLTFAEGGLFRESPVVLFMDEAGETLSTENSALRDKMGLTALSDIIKGGRIHGLTVCFSCSNPALLDRRITQYIGMFIVHRLKHSDDCDTIRQLSGSTDDPSMQLIPFFHSGDAALIGYELAEPVLLNIIPPRQTFEPGLYSGFSRFQKFWRHAAEPKSSLSILKD
ncbi:MAG: DUF87 domain-containing protein [bacterium]|nr:DUF87 domain-containing protein [bacterium]